MILSAPLSLCSWGAQRRPRRTLSRGLSQPLLHTTPLHLACSVSIITFRHLSSPRCSISLLHFQSLSSLQTFPSFHHPFLFGLSLPVTLFIPILLSVFLMRKSAEGPTLSLASGSSHTSNMLAILYTLSCRLSHDTKKPQRVDIQSACLLTACLSLDYVSLHAIKSF